jgi:hypothetical protein
MHGIPPNPQQQGYCENAEHSAGPVVPSLGTPTAGAITKQTLQTVAHVSKNFFEIGWLLP